MSTPTTVATPNPVVGSTGARPATPYFLGDGRENPAARVPALRVVVRREDLPNGSLEQLTRFALRCGDRVPSSPGRSGAAADPVLDGWIARFENRGCTVSVFAHGRTLVVAPVAPPPPPGWRRSVAGGGVVCLAVEVRASDPRREGPALMARLPVRLG